MSIKNVIKEKFGGASKLANGLEYPQTTVQSWINRGRIPSKHFARIIDFAKIRGIPLDVKDLIY